MPGPNFNLKGYNPEADKLPPNRAARRALEARNRLLTRKFASIVRRYVGKPVDQSNVTKMVRELRKELGVTTEAALTALEKAGVIERGVVTAEPLPTATETGLVVPHGFRSVESGRVSSSAPNMSSTPRSEGDDA